MRGRIVSSSCGVYSIDVDGVIYNAPARGLFRNRGVKPTVGDDVEISEEQFVIQQVYDRVSFLKRPPIANIDQMLIVESLKEPEFSYLLAFKYLTYANMNGINAKIILTKSDKEEDKTLIDEIIKNFKMVNIDTYVVSNKTMEGLEEVKKLFANHITCLLGQSGVGKSSLINSIDKDFERKVAEQYKDSTSVSQTVIIPFQDWAEKKDHLAYPREVIFPFKEYDFAGHKLFSFNDVEEFCRLCYGEKCLKKFVDGEWVNPLPMRKRNAKHNLTYNLDSKDKR